MCQATAHGTGLRDEENDQSRIIKRVNDPSCPGRTAEVGQESRAMVDVAAGETSTCKEKEKKSHEKNAKTKGSNEASSSQSGSRGGRWDMSAEQYKEKRSW